MYGPGAPPPTRSAGSVITLRVLFAAAGFLSCGVLACVPLFRVAFLRGRWFDWTAAWVSLPLSIVCFAVVGSVKESDVRGDIALATVLLLGALGSAYFVVMDIRLDGGQRQFAGYAPPPAMPGMPSGYGYPQAPTPSPYANTQTGPQPPMPHTPIPQAQGPVPPPPPQRPGPARIDQVRAELDELSDYLRRNPGHTDGEHEGGR